jgi:hypothetical protein
LLNDEAGLAIDRALGDGQAGEGLPQPPEPTNDLIDARDRMPHRVHASATIADRSGVGRKKCDQRIDIAGLPCDLELTDDAGLSRWSNRGA